jgi:hypothetical protein
MEHPERIVRCQLWVQLCDAALDRRVPHAGGRGVRHNLHQPRVGASKDLRPPTAGLRDHLEAQLRYRTAVTYSSYGLRAAVWCMVLEYGMHTGRAIPHTRLHTVWHTAIRLWCLGPLLIETVKSVVYTKTMVACNLVRVNQLR